MPKEVRVTAYSGAEATLSDELLALYGRVYAEAPYWDGPADVAEFAAEWPRLNSEPGFRLVVARSDSAGLVGFVLGHLVSPDSGWWTGIDPIPVNGAEPTFGVAEFGVHRAWRRSGIARRLHDALLDGQAASQVVLWVRTDAPAAQAAYTRWGYRHAGTIGRPPDRSYHVLFLDRG
jgi:ribosomal protein S18 acetylase RimI-like enzyme